MEQNFLEDHELMLKDRLGVIKDTITKYGEENFYLSFSGGKDSTILHYLVDMALPGNKIPRVYINTGIEYLDVVNYVKSFAEKDNRFVIILPEKPIRQVLEEYGYPFKSKAHSHTLNVYQHKGMSKGVDAYLNRHKGQWMCPKCLRYQFTPEFNIKISDLCCMMLKKKPVAKWMKENKRPITMTGLRSEEGGQRALLKDCILTDKKGNVKKFHPLVKVSQEWEEWFVKKFNIQLCKLYYEPFNFKRTGCKGCPFALNLKNELKVLKERLPNEYNQCEFIWKPIYDEYRRIGYRLKEDKEEKDGI